VLPVGRLSSALEEAARNSLIAPPPFAQAHTFTSQSLYDAIYGTLSHATKRDWHERAGDRLVQTDEAALYERLEQVAYHYSRGGNSYKAAHFTRLAGDKARTGRADDTALAFYKQTLSVVEEADVAAERRLAREGIGDVRALQGEGQAAIEAYRAAFEGAPPEDLKRLEAKLALLSPLVGPAEPESLEEVWHQLPASVPLRPWLGAALCWAHAERGEADAAAAVCRDLSAAVGETADGFLREMLGGLDRGEPLLSYSDFFALFAPNYLRVPSGGEP
jgi:tetratricopeptide (TPR) repeat protein